MQESEQDPMASDFDNAQKMRQAEKRPNTQSSSSTISGAPSIQF